MPSGAVTVAILQVLLVRTIKAQLQVQIRKYSQVSLNDTELGGNFTVLGEYTFPSGLSTDWFVTSHANIPAEGITGLLYQPLLQEDCQPTLNASTQQNYCAWNENANLPRLILLEDVNACTHPPSYFNALITYSPNGITRDIKNYPLFKIPLAIVSETFYLKLQDSLQDCSEDMEDTTLVNISVGDADVVYFRMVLVMVVLLGGIMCLCVVIIVLALTVLFCSKCLRKRGSYNVHDHQLHELGPTEDALHHRGTFRDTLTLPYSPEERQFHSGDAQTQCAICLEDFMDGEVTSVLACSASHAFHPTCINKWLESQSTCPVCRTLMTSTLLQ